jgi:hypothetical protein
VIDEVNAATGGTSHGFICPVRGQRYVNDSIEKDEHTLDECGLIQIKPDCAMRRALVRVGRKSVSLCATPMNKQFDPSQWITN